jgi:flagella basal body P-ring formation protein FlgA
VKWVCVLGLLLPFVASPALTQGIDGARAVALVEEAMQRAGLPVPPMAQPLRALPACDGDPRVVAFQGSWAAAELICDSPGWRRVLRTGMPGARVPDADRLDASGAAAIVVTAARPLRRGEVVMAADLVTAPVAQVDPAQALADPALALGRRLRAAVGQGQPVLERHLAPRHLVAEGQRVAIVLQSGAITVASEGVALGNGLAGEIVGVQMPEGRRIEAEVAGPRNLIVRPKIR